MVIFTFSRQGGGRGKLLFPAPDQGVDFSVDVGGRLLAQRGVAEDL